MTKIDSKITVRELLVSHPRAVQVFMQRKMLCIGCATEGYHTLAEAARLHGFSWQEFEEAIEAVINIEMEP